MPLLEIASWARGLIFGEEPRKLPLDAYARGKNNELRRVELGGEQLALPARRKGCRVINATSIDSNKPILRLMPFESVGDGGRVPYLMVQGLPGVQSLQLITADGQVLAATGAYKTFGASTVPAAFAPARNVLYMATGGGAVTDTIAWDRTITAGVPVPRAWGIRALNWTEAITAADRLVGASYNLSGTYDIAVTAYRATDGYESSLSEPYTHVTGGTNEQVTLTWTTAGWATEGTHTRIYIRKRSLQGSYFLLATVTRATTTYTFNQTDAQLTALTLRAPSTTENNPPPRDLRVLAWYGERMFGSNGSTLAFSNLNKPESFDPTNVEDVRGDDGKGRIVALHPEANELLIFKERALYGLVGSIDPRQWSVELLEPDIGCADQQAVCTLDGYTYWWSPQVGPVRRQAGGRVERLGNPALLAAVNRSVRGPAYKAVADPSNGRVFFAVPINTETRSVRLLPYNARLEAWESDGWDILDAAGLCTMDFGDGPAVYLGSHQGQLFKLNETGIDGVPSGTTSGTVEWVASGGAGGFFSMLAIWVGGAGQGGSVASGATISSGTLTDPAASFLTTGGGLRERYVYLQDQAATEQIFRVRILSNTGTVLTTSPFNVPSGTYTYYIGGIDWQLDTPTLPNNAAFTNNRYQHIMIQGESVYDYPLPTLTIDQFINFQEMKVGTTTVSIDTNTFNPAQQNAYVWGVTPLDTLVTGDRARQMITRFRVGRVAHALRLRFRILPPNQDFMLLRVGVTFDPRTLRVN